MQRKILVVTDNLKDQINGVVTTFSNIESYANSSGYDIVYLDPGQFPHIACPGYPEVKLSWAKGVAKKIQDIDPDFIHIATEGPIGLAVRLYCERKNIPYNTSYHTKFPEFLKKLYGIPEAWTYAYLKWFHSKSYRVLATTNTMLNELKEKGFVDNVVVWTRGVNRSIFSSKLRTLDLPLRPVILNVGRVSKEKGLDDFCQLPHVTKVIVGDGPYKSELEKMYPDVIFAGVKKGVELAEYYANADVFVFPSKTDTFGIVIIESLACGTPVAAYPVAGPIDILEAGVTGFLSNNLETAVNLCLTLDRTGVEKASQQWSWEECWAIFRKNLVFAKKIIKY